MQQIFKTIFPFRWMAIILLTSTIMVACNDGKTDSTNDGEMVDTMMVKDSMPPLDTDSNSSLRPETIKSKPSN